MNTTIKELTVGDMFRFKGETNLNTYMGIFSYKRGEYLIYKNAESNQLGIKKLNLYEEIQIIS